MIDLKAHRIVLTKYFAGLCGLIIILGCVNLAPNSELSVIYSRAAQHNSELRNPVIIIPGILGSKLLDRESGRIVWGAFGGDSANPESPDGARMTALPMGIGQNLADLRDQVDPAGALEQVQVNLFGLPLKLNAYINILSTLGAGGFLDEQLALAGAVHYGDDHYSCFQFDYDWRRDNVENAKRLHAFILKKRVLVQAQIERRFGIKDYDVQFDIVAHSMGGLITRYYLRYGDADLPEDGSTPQITWDGTKHVDRVILVGTPNGGSYQALDQLVHGAKFASLLPSVHPAILGTMPAVYQLLPRGRHKPVVDSQNESGEVDLHDPRLWEELGWGLAGKDHNAAFDQMIEILLPDVKDRKERRRIALDHQSKCLSRARQFAAALDTPSPYPQDVQIYLFAGDSTPTPSGAKIDRASGGLWVTEYSPGDGTVTRTSALLDERQGGEWAPRLRSPIPWRQVFFIFSDHLGMTKDPVFSDNVLYLLLEDPRS